MNYYTRQQLPPIGARVVGRAGAITVPLSGADGRRMGTVVAQGNYNDWTALTAEPHAEDKERVWYPCVRWDGYDYEQEVPVTGRHDLSDLDREAWHSEWPDSLELVALPAEDDDLAVLTTETG